jgi:hypothetical protein
MDDPPPSSPHAALASKQISENSGNHEKRLDFIRASEVSKFN